MQTNYQYLQRTRCFQFRCIACKTSKSRKSNNTDLIDREENFMGENSRDKQNNRRRQLFQLLKVQSLLKKPRK